MNARGSLNLGFISMALVLFGSFAKSSDLIDINKPAPGLYNTIVKINKYSMHTESCPIDAVVCKLDGFKASGESDLAKEGLHFSALSDGRDISIDVHEQVLTDLPRDSHQFSPGLGEGIEILKSCKENASLELLDSLFLRFNEKMRDFFNDSYKHELVLRQHMAMMLHSNVQTADAQMWGHLKKFYDENGVDNAFSVERKTTVYSFGGEDDSDFIMNTYFIIINRKVDRHGDPVVDSVLLAHKISRFNLSSGDSLGSWTTFSEPISLLDSTKPPPDSGIQVKYENGQNFLEFNGPVSFNFDQKIVQIEKISDQTFTFTELPPLTLSSLGGLINAVLEYFFGFSP